MPCNPSYLVLCHGTEGIRRPNKRDGHREGVAKEEAPRRCGKPLRLGPAGNCVQNELKFFGALLKLEERFLRFWTHPKVVVPSHDFPLEFVDPGSHATAVEVHPVLH